MTFILLNIRSGFTYSPQGKVLAEIKASLLLLFFAAHRAPLTRRVSSCHVTSHIIRASLNLFKYLDRLPSISEQVNVCVCFYLLLLPRLCVFVINQIFYFRHSLGKTRRKRSSLDKTLAHSQNS
jgi:hypothetical protein